VAAGAESVDAGVGIARVREDQFSSNQSRAFQSKRTGPATGPAAAS
jgi:hypothetical protein